MRRLYVKCYDAAAAISGRIYAKIAKILKGRSTGLKNAALWAMILIFSFGAVLLCNLTSDYHGDDLRYLCVIEAGKPLSSAVVPLENLDDIVESQYNHYMYINGRTVAHFTLQAALHYLSEDAVDVVCSLFTVALALLIALYGTYGEGPHRLSKTAYITAFSLLVLLNPALKDTVFWNTGVFNYNFTILIVLCFFGPYLRLIGQDTASRSPAAELLRAVGLAALGFAGGWTNENIAPTLVFAVALILMHRGWYLRKKVCFSDVCGLLGAAAGCCMLLLSPSNRVRSASIAGKNDVYGGAMKVIIRLYYMERAFFIYLFGVLAFIAALLIVNKLFLQKKLTFQMGILMLWAFLSFAAMIMSPSYPPRAVFGTLAILLIPIVMLVNRIKESDSRAKACVTAFSTLLFLCSVAELATTALYSVFKIEA